MKASEAVPAEAAIAEDVVEQEFDEAEEEYDHNDDCVIDGDEELHLLIEEEKLLEEVVPSRTTAEAAEYHLVPACLDAKTPILETHPT